MTEGSSEPHKPSKRPFNPIMNDVLRDKEITFPTDLKGIKKKKRKLCTITIRVFKVLIDSQLILAFQSSVELRIHCSTRLENGRTSL